MTRAAWERTITDSAGNVLTGVQITVFQSDGVTLATIYGQQSGGSALANPFNTGVQTSAKFYADAGRYVIRAFKDGLTKEFTDVDIAGRSVRDDIGTAAYLTATTSTTDVTQGRAMRSGDYGVGALAGPSELTPGAVRQNRMMSVSASWDGSPIAGVDAGNQGQMLHMQHGDPTYAVQILYSLLSATGDLTRRISNNVVGPWARNITSANMVGSVFAQGGAPALFSAVLEYGTNVNGTYLKMADGTALAWGRVIQTGLSISPTKLGNSNTAFSCTPTLPMAFEPGVVVNIGQRAFYDSANEAIYSIAGSGFNGDTLMYNLGTKPSVFWPALDTFGTAVAVKVDFYWSAIGRWR